MALSWVIKGQKLFRTKRCSHHLVTDKKYINIDELFTYLDERYDVTYQSKQSYYELMRQQILVGRNHRRSTQGSTELVKKAKKSLIS